MLRSGVVENEPSLVGLLAQYFSDLASLKVICASYRDITSFMRALAGSFPRLVELTIELGAGTLDLPDAALSGLRNLKLAVPCLRMLRVVGWNNEFVRWLGDNISGTLERLELDCTLVRPMCRVQEADALIQGNKETLRDLRLGYVERRDSVVFDLTGVKGLKNLEVAAEVAGKDLFTGCVSFVG
ncbi:hypothetical protein BDZ89DRAFT_668894 [Hymenopellis radicata]|nr:hypothetical protein BDZ89DRAFT_668894 [Hymenopellis radicata]